MSFCSWMLPSTLLCALGAAAFFSACSQGEPEKISDAQQREMKIYRESATASLTPNVVTPVGVPAKDPKQLFREARVYKDLIPRGIHARKYRRKMDPKFITIHSTQNFSSSADAWRHSLALKNGKLRAYKSRNGNRIGYLVWHYTVDQNVVVQHLPTNEQGEHADFDGPGNNFSIGIEMCENKGNSRSETLERTAKLTAYLMYEHDIPLNNVVPHYHWPRMGLSKLHKNCPHYLLDDGKPGKKWKWFLAKIKKHHDSITKTVSPLNGSAPIMVQPGPAARARYIQ